MMLTFDAMKSYFIRLFNYNEFANRQIAQLIIERNDKDKPLKLMGHLLAAEQTWLKRCMGFPAPGGPLWPDIAPDTLNEIVTNNHADWLAYLNGLNEDDFNNVINYKNYAGEEYNTLLADILAHVINHGTHTRAQAGQHLKLNIEDKLPITDYSYYLRQLIKP